MNIVVCIKQVPDTKGGVKFKPDGTLDRGAMLAIMNPDDKAALEAALRIKDENDAKVSVITMGLPKADAVLREALAMGADEAFLVTDRGAIRKLPYDLVLTGRQAIDGDTAQVGPQISEKLGIPVISYAEEIHVDGGEIEVKRQFEDRYHLVRAKLPCLVTALSELNEPRYMTPGGIFDAFEKEVTVLSRQDLQDVNDSDIGLAGSPTMIARASDKVKKGAGQKVVPDSPDEGAEFILEKLKEKHIL